LLREFGLRFCAKDFANFLKFLFNYLRFWANFAFALFRKLNKSRSTLKGLLKKFNFHSA